jgi:hypothetical protein
MEQVGHEWNGEDGQPAGVRADLAERIPDARRKRDDVSSQHQLLRDQRGKQGHQQNQQSVTEPVRHRRKADDVVLPEHAQFGTVVLQKDCSVVEMRGAILRREVTESPDQQPAPARSVRRTPQARSEPASPRSAGWSHGTQDHRARGHSRAGFPQRSGRFAPSSRTLGSSTPAQPQHDPGAGSLPRPELRVGMTPPGFSS